MHKKHISSVRLYLEDLALMDRPWEKWECFFQGKWKDLQSEPGWHNDMVYRRKPDVIKVGNLEFPKPESAPPPQDTTYYYPSTFECKVSSTRWYGTSYDLFRLSHGMVHLTQGAAMKHLNAILSLTQSDSSARSFGLH